MLIKEADMNIRPAECCENCMHSKWIDGEIDYLTCTLKYPRFNGTERTDVCNYYDNGRTISVRGILEGKC